MSRLRYPFTEISARCRLCGAEGLTASSEHALGGRLIDWRRSHAPVCPEWPRWAEKKGLRLDERGALRQPKHLSINKIGHAMHELDPVFERFSHDPRLHDLAAGVALDAYVDAAVATFLWCARVAPEQSAQEP